MIGGIPNFIIPGASHSMTNGAKMSLPVDSSALIYSHFQHVSGVPAQSGTQGVAITRLNLLDVLIEQLNQIKKTSPIEINVDSTKGVDTLMENIKIQIQQAQAASAAMPYIPSPNAQSGSLFNLLN